MEAVVEQTLGNVHRSDAGLLFDFSGAGHEFMHAAIAVGDLKEVLDLAQQIVGIQHCVFRGFPKTLATQRANVEVTSQKNSHIAEERADLTDGLRWLRQ